MTAVYCIINKYNTLFKMFNFCMCIYTYIYIILSQNVSICQNLQTNVVQYPLTQILDIKDIKISVHYKIVRK